MMKVNKDVNVHAGHFYQVIKQVLDEMRQQFNEKFKDQAEIDFNMTITKQKINLVNVQARQLKLMLEDEQIDQETYDQSMEKLKSIKKKEAETLYMRIEQVELSNEYLPCEERDFVPGFKYERLIDGEWISDEWPENMEPPTDEELDNTWRKFFRRTTKDLVYNNQYILPEGNKLKDRDKGYQWLYKACVFDMMAQSFQLNAMESRTRREREEQAFMQKQVEEHKSKIEHAPKMEVVSEGRVKDEQSRPIDKEYVKEIKKKRAKAGIDEKGNKITRKSKKNATKGK